MVDLILTNGRIRTMDPARPVAEALTVRGERVLAVGSADEARAAADTRAEVVDLGGRDVLPGLVDAHLHFDWYSRGLQAVDAETDTLAECLRRVAKKAAKTPEGQWVLGLGWNQNEWGGQFPTAGDLDSVAPRHPVILKAKSGHAAWVNSLAMQLAGITAGATAPLGGEIQRDARGIPTGIFFEDAIELVDHLVPDTTPEQLAELMRPAMQNAWRVGLTGIHDFDGRRSFAAFQLLKARGELGLRVVKQIQVKHLGEAVGLGLRSGFGDDWLRIGNIKVFLDGALGPRTAAMIAPYEGEPKNTGIVVTDKEALYEHATLAAANGLAMTVHAIGDRANHDLLDVYATIRREEAGRGQASLRHRCEHVQVLHPNDYGRLAQLNVVASMQPIHATSDMLMADRYWGKRTAGAYALRTQLEAGAPLAFGSDAPVENFNPFWGIHAAVTRRRADGAPGPEGWHPEQRLSVAEAVHGFTLGAAYAGYMEDRQGRLAAGRLADLIVVDRDIFSVEPMAIKDTQVLGTLVGGDWRYRDF
ncbi:MAG: amidohydrolase [Anaerolineales bacterium]|nr:amidohydrolase [Anaerolineales bacterium]